MKNTVKNSTIATIATLWSEAHHPGGPYAAPTAKALQYHPTDRALDRACRVTMPELKGWWIKRSAQLDVAAAKGLFFFLESKEGSWNPTERMQIGCFRKSGVR